MKYQEGDVNQKSKKAHYKILNCFTNQEKLLLILYNDYSSIASEAKHKAKHGEGLKILTSSQMLQKLPIALAKVKADNTSGNLQNEIRKIIYSLYIAKQII